MSWKYIENELYLLLLISQYNHSSSSGQAEIALLPGTRLEKVSETQCRRNTVAVEYVVTSAPTASFTDLETATILRSAISYDEKYLSSDVPSEQEQKKFIYELVNKWYLCNSVSTNKNQTYRCAQSTKPTTTTLQTVLLKLVPPRQIPDTSGLPANKRRSCQT